MTKPGWQRPKVLEGTAFLAKPQLLRLIIERVVAAGIPFGWVTATATTGDNGCKITKAGPER